MPVARLLLLAALSTVPLTILGAPGVAAPQRSIARCWIEERSGDVSLRADEHHASFSMMSGHFHVTAFAQTSSAAHRQVFVDHGFLHPALEAILYVSVSAERAHRVQGAIVFRAGGRSYSRPLPRRRATVVVPLSEIVQLLDGERALTVELVDRTGTIRKHSTIDAELIRGGALQATRLVERLIEDIAHREERCGGDEIIVT